MTNHDLIQKKFMVVSEHWNTQSTMKPEAQQCTFPGSLTLTLFTSYTYIYGLCPVSTSVILLDVLINHRCFVLYP